MKTKNLILLVPVLLLVSFRAIAPPAELTKAERKLVIDRMKETRELVLKNIKGLSPEQLNYKATPDSWSVAECVEHIALSENNIFGMIQGTLKEAADASKTATKKDEEVFNGISDRSWKVKTSEAFVPTGKFGTFDKTVDEFKTKREATIKYLEGTKEDLRGHFFTFPAEALGTMDSFQLFLFMAGHTKRHALQIEEVKADAGFPKK